MNRRNIGILAALLVLSGDLSTALAQQANSDPEYRKLRNSQLSESFVVENSVIQRDVGVITLRQGTVSFVPPVLGRVTLGVFVGEGDFALTPAVASERNHLVSAIGENSVHEAFDRAVFVFTDDSYREIKGTARSRPVTAEANDELTEIRQRLRRRPEQIGSLAESILWSENMDNVEADTLADLYNPRQAGFFSAYMHGRKYNDLRFHLRPRAALPPMDSPEEVALIYLAPGNLNEGIWYLAHTRAEYANGSARSSEDKRIVDAEHYRIETQLGKNDHLSGKTEFQFRAMSDGDRVIKFGLLPTLRVTSVRIADREVPFIQEDRKEDGSFYVVTPEAMVKDRSYQLAIEYSGDKVIEKAGGGNFYVGARTSWYPSVNSFNYQAKYDLVYKVPREYTLVSVGKPKKETREGDFTVSEWVSEIPLAVAGFNYGTFKKKPTTIPALSYTLEGYANPEMPDYLRGVETKIGGVSPTNMLDNTLAQTSVAMRIFDKFFGPAPYGRIAITQQPDFNFGQSWPSLVYLPMSAFFDSTQRYQLMQGNNKGLTDFIQEVTPHEVSHQWWGHMVGWSSYRDQWLSEGFADFSAGLFLQLSEQKPEKYLKYLETARDDILNKNSFGFSPNEAGPLNMGIRLNTPRAGSAYQRLVYPKGGYVLHMLRSMMWDAQTGDQRFIDMMHDYVQTHLYKSASTESFQAIVEKHMTPIMDPGNHKMDWFFQEWVYGTEVPKYKFDYDVTPGADGKFRLKASLTQSGVSDAFRMPVPIYMDLDGHMVRLGTVVMTGNTTKSNLELALPQKPKRVLINANFDVLAQKS